MEYGYLEALMRGFRSGFLTEFEYNQLCLCESLDDVRLTLSDTDYKLVLQSLPPSPTTEIIFEKCRSKTIQEFSHIQRQAAGPLASFIEFITYEYLIQSIQFVITGLIKGSRPEQLLAKCHPLGRSAHLRSMLAFDNFEGGDGLVELYRTVLIDTPVAPYFERYFTGEFKGGGSGSELARHYDEREIDIITNMLQKMWLEDFYGFCQELGGDTWLAMKELLEFEADRRAINITISSFGTTLNDPVNRDSKRQELYCNFGKLYPEATMGKFNKVSDMQTLALELTPYKGYSELWKQAQEGNRSFTDMLYQREVELCIRAFEGQSHVAIFYAYTKLKQQEERNLKWILSCISQKRDAKEKARWIKTFY